LLVRAFLLVCMPLLLVAGGYSHPKSFSHAVKIFKQLDLDYTRTAFTDEPYAYDAATCMRKLYVKNDHKRAVVFVRIVPEEIMGKTRQCFTQKPCIKSNGQKYGGARCCRQKDEVYQHYDRDIFNVMPIVKGTPYISVKPPLHARGNIARVYLYMNARYGLNLSYDEQMTYLKWHKEDRVDERECSMHKQIVKIQGLSNPWIKSACETSKSKSSKSSQP